MSLRTKPPFGIRLLRIVILAIVYFGVAKLRPLMAFEETSVSPVWPPIGL